MKLDHLAGVSLIALGSWLLWFMADSWGQVFLVPLPLTVFGPWLLELIAVATIVYGLRALLKGRVRSPWGVSLITVSLVLLLLPFFYEPNGVASLYAVTTDTVVLTYATLNSLIVVWGAMLFGRAG